MKLRLEVLPYSINNYKLHSYCKYPFYRNAVKDDETINIFPKKNLN